jgi:hypothetical protein
MARAECPDRYGWWLSELESLAVNARRNMHAKMGSKLAS